jgi:hypothetical protein
MTEAELETFIKDAFAENFELLRLEIGHSVTEDVRQAALDQVMLYWEKLKDIALKVSDTEVKLTLPQQTTPAGRTYSIEGVVDIVQEDEATWMYDLKTHDADFVRAHRDLYEKQLNIYAHIWQTLRGQKLDGTAILATSPTRRLREAFRNKDTDPARLAKELSAWEPLVEIPFDSSKVGQTVQDFGAVVDMIESRQFAAPPVDKLKTRIVADKRATFGQEVCVNCDARFSCDPYREYARSAIRDRDAAIRYFFDDYGDEQTRADWLDGNLPASTINQAT